jgi:hypothetical protein
LIRGDCIAKRLYPGIFVIGKTNRTLLSGT